MANGTLLIIAGERENRAKGQESLPSAELVIGSAVEICDGVVQALVLDMADIVPLAGLQLGHETLADGLLGGRRQREVHARGVVAPAGLEEVGGKEEGERGVDAADGAGQRVSESTGGRSDSCVGPSESEADGIP